MTLAVVNTTGTEADPAERVTTLRWGRELFLAGEQTPYPCPPDIDVTGRARFLFYGPYQPVSPGLWRVTVSLHLSQDAAKCRLAAQLGAEPDYTTVDLTHGRSGRQEIEIEHVFKAGDFAQVRLWLKKAAFHGDLRLLGAVARFIEPAPSASFG